MKILVPTDFTSASQTATEAAVRLAHLCEAEVVIHHVYMGNLDWSKLAVQPDDETAASMTNIEQARAVLAGMESRHSDISLYTQLSDYETVEELLTQARNEAIELIIVGTHGERELANRIMGSDTQRIVRLAHCPVIVLPDANLAFPFKCILFVSDLTEDFSPQLARLLNLAQCMGAEVHLGFVNTPMDFRCDEDTEAGFEKLRGDFPGAPLPGHIYNHVRVDRGIHLMTQQAGADAIALVTHSRKGIQRLFYSSLTEKIALNSDFPIVSFHHKG